MSDNIQNNTAARARTDISNAAVAGKTTTGGGANPEAATAALAARGIGGPDLAEMARQRKIARDAAAAKALAAAKKPVTSKPMSSQK